jgi:hypothetical protein
MLSFRQFQAGPDPLGRTYQIYFKWLQTAISLRHSDTVDVKFVLEIEGVREEKTISIEHARLLELGHPLTDPWCARLAALHLRRVIATGEDMEKPLVTVPPEDLAAHAAELERMEGKVLGAH